MGVYDAKVAGGRGALQRRDRPLRGRFGFPAVPFFFSSDRKEKRVKKIAILMGSASDLVIAKKAADTLTAFGVPHEVHVCSAHRTPDIVRDIAQNARGNGFGAIICVAGMAAHLAGAVAANTTLPVVGVPVASQGLGGLDALLSTVQMPSGIPVASVAVDGAKNAALLCIQMLAIQDDDLAAKLTLDRGEQARKARLADQDIAAQFGEPARDGGN